MAERTGTLIMVAPNGARRGKADHPDLPMTAPELARTAARCREAGAAAIHLHVRDSAGVHSLDAGLYREVIEAVDAATGGDMVVQITTEAVGRYRPGEQMALVKALRPGFVSMAVRELIAGAEGEPEAARFFAWMRRECLVPQFILYDAADVHRLDDLIRRGVIPAANPFVLYVLGRYSSDQTSEPADLDPFLEAAGTQSWPWMVCAFGPRETACMARGFESGGHGRVGFENNLYRPDGTLAPDNAALVTAAADAAQARGHTLMTPDELRALLSQLW